MSQQSGNEGSYLGIGSAFWTTKKDLPLISIVTPSYNQGQFLEETIQSVLEQNYPNLEYIIIDGSSTDKSIDIIRKYEHRLAYWVSEPDRGHFDGINKGFKKSTGEIMAWINSDDKYTPWAFSVVAEIFCMFPEVEWLTTVCPLTWDEKGRAVGCTYQGGFNRQAFFKGINLPGRRWYARSVIQQESTFWRRSLWQSAGGYIDATVNGAGDFELWARFYHHAELYGVATPLGGFRVQSKQFTAHHLEDYLAKAEIIFRCYGGHPYSRLESMLRSRIGNYLRPFGYFYRSGRLKRLFDVFAYLGILYPTKVFFHKGQGGGWRLPTVYII